MNTFFGRKNGETTLLAQKDVKKTMKMKNSKINWSGIKTEVVALLRIYYLANWSRKMFEHNFCLCCCSLSLNERFVLEGGFVGLFEWIVKHEDLYFPTWLARDILTGNYTYQQVRTLSNVT